MGTGNGSWLGWTIVTHCYKSQSSHSGKYRRWGLVCRTWMMRCSAPALPPGARHVHQQGQPGAAAAAAGPHIVQLHVPAMQVL